MGCKYQNSLFKDTSISCQEKNSLFKDTSISRQEQKSAPRGIQVPGQAAIFLPDRPGYVGDGTACPSITFRARTVIMNGGQDIRFINSNPYKKNRWDCIPVRFLLLSRGFKGEIA